MEFSINTIGLYPDLSLEDTIRASLSHGFSTFEQWSVSSDGIADMARLEREYPVRFSTVAARDYILNDSKHLSLYLTSLEQYLKELTATSCRTVITQVGQDTGGDRTKQHSAIVTGLRAAVPILEKYGFVLMVEPLNTVKDHIGYYLDSSEEGFEIIREVGSPNVRLLFDVYHQLQMGENVIEKIHENLPLIAHFHIAGIPNRDEDLWNSRADYDPILTLIRESGTKAPVGIELFPKASDGSDRVLERLRQYL